MVTEKLVKLAYFTSSISVVYCILLWAMLVEKEPVHENILPFFWEQMLILPIQHFQCRLQDSGHLDHVQKLQRQ